MYWCCICAGLNHLSKMLVRRARLSSALKTYISRPEINLAVLSETSNFFLQAALQERMMQQRREQAYANAESYATLSSTAREKMLETITPAARKEMFEALNEA